jgi:hypothetical protein
MKRKGLEHGEIREGSVICLLLNVMMMRFV